MKSQFPESFEEHPANDAPIARHNQYEFQRNVLIVIALALVVGGFLWFSLEKKRAEAATAARVEMIAKEARTQKLFAETNAKLDELKLQLARQEAKVAEKREALAAMVEKAGIHRIEETSRELAIQRGMDAQDYIDAKRDFETDQELLKVMKTKRDTFPPGQVELDRAVRDQEAKVEERRQVLAGLEKKASIK